jgi:hypothetical protein
VRAGEESEGLGAKLRDTFKAMVGQENATQTFAAMANRVNEAEASIDSLTGATKRITTAQVQYYNAQVLVNSIIKRFGAESEIGKLAAIELKIATDKLRGAMKSQGVAVAELQTAEESLTQTRKRLIGIADDLTTAELDQRDARRALTDALRTLHRLEEDGVHSGRKYAEARDAVTRAEVNLRSATERTHEAQKALLENLAGAANKGRSAEEAFLKLADSLGVNSHKARDLIDNLMDGQSVWDKTINKIDLSERQSRILSKAFGLLNESAAESSVKVGHEIGKIPGIISQSRELTESRAKALGAGISTGIALGVSGGQSSVITAATNVALAGIGAAKAALGMRSPSRVFRDIGLNISESMGLGIEDGMTSVTESMQRVAAAAAASMGDQPGGDFAIQARGAAGVAASPAASPPQGVTNVRNNYLNVTGVLPPANLDEETIMALFRRMEFVWGG